MKSYKSVIKAYDALSEPIKYTLADFDALLKYDEISWNACVSYIFSQIENIRRYALYLIAVKKWNIDPDVTREAVDRLELKDDQFWRLLESVSETDFPNDFKAMLTQAKRIRNQIVHGQSGWTDKDARAAIGACFGFLEKFDLQLKKKALPSPFGNLQGKLAIGKGPKRLDKSTSRLVLRGLRFID